MRKGNLKISENTVVHCSTEELANKVLAIADNLGCMWIGGSLYTMHNNYDKCGNTTVYDLHRGTYFDLKEINRTNYNVISAEEFIKRHQSYPTSFEKVEILFDVSKIGTKGIEITTADGHSVRIICTDAKKNHYPIIALVTFDNEAEVVRRYDLKGQNPSYCSDSQLIMWEKREVTTMTIKEIEESLGITNLRISI